VSHQDTSSSVVPFPFSAVLGSGGSCGPVLAQCFWFGLSAKVACVSARFCLCRWLEWCLCGCLECGV